MKKFFVALFLLTSGFGALAQNKTSIPCIEDLAVPGGVTLTDNTPALNYAIANYEAVRFCATVTLGRYRFATEPNVIDKSFAVYGALPGTPAMTWLDRDYQPSTGTRGLFHSIDGQLYVQDLMMLAKSGSQGAAISIVPKVGGASAQYGLKSIRITTSGGTWNHDIYVNGNNMVSPQGVRGLTITDAMLFGTNSTSVHLDNVVHFNIIGGSINSAGGVGGHLWVGSSTPGAPSTTGTIRLDYITGNIGFAAATNIIADVGFVGGLVANTSSASGIRGRGVAAGGVQSFWSNSSWN